MSPLLCQLSYGPSLTKTKHSGNYKELTSLLQYNSQSGKTKKATFWQSAKKAIKMVAGAGFEPATSGL
jgi:hypothetical protein